MLNNNEITALLPKLIAYATRLLGSPAMAEDLVHDSIVQALAADSFDESKSSLSNYLHLTVRGRVFNHKAKACNRLSHMKVMDTDVPNIELKGDQDIQKESGLQLAGPESDPEARDQIAALEACNVHEKALIEALALGHSLSVAADMVGVSVATACRWRKDIARRIGR